jgi:hypothetical protein
MVSCENRVAQVIELVPTASAFISLSIGLIGMKTTLIDFVGYTVWATNSVRPAQLADHCKAFGVVNEMLDVQHDRIVPAST